jgi:hypothetical protein
MEKPLAVSDCRRIPIDRAMTGGPTQVFAPVLWTPPPPVPQTPPMGVQLGAHDPEEPDANDLDRRSRYREVCSPGSLRRRGMPCCAAGLSVGTYLRFSGSYRLVSSGSKRAPRLAPTPGLRPHRSADAHALCEALCQERFCRRESNLRSGHQAEHAVRTDHDA